MSYGIIYLYRLSDFLCLARAHGVERVYLTACWLKENDPDWPAEAPTEHSQWTDCHELSFMGAFGMGYKMHVDGGVHLGKVPDNDRLWIKAQAVKARIHEVWRERVVESRKTVPDIIVVPGTLIRPELDVVAVFGHTRVP